MPTLVNQGLPAINPDQLGLPTYHKTPAQKHQLPYFMFPCPVSIKLYMAYFFLSSIIIFFFFTFFRCLNALSFFSRLQRPFPLPTMLIPYVLLQQTSQSCSRCTVVTIQFRKAIQKKVSFFRWNTILPNKVEVGIHPFDLIFYFSCASQIISFVQKLWVCKEVD